MSISGSFGFSLIASDQSYDDYYVINQHSRDVGLHEPTQEEIDSLKESLFRAGDLIAELRQGIIFVENVRDKLLVENKKLREENEAKERKIDEQYLQLKMLTSPGLRPPKP